MFSLFADFWSSGLCCLLLILAVHIHGGKFKIYLSPWRESSPKRSEHSLWPGSCRVQSATLTMILQEYEARFPIKNIIKTRPPGKKETLCRLVAKFLGRRAVRDRRKKYRLGREGVTPVFEEGAVSDVQLHDEPNNLYFALTLHCFDKLFTKLPTTGKSYTLLRGLARYWPHMVATRLHFLDIWKYVIKKKKLRIVRLIWGH